MINEDVLDLYPRVPVGMRVTVTWQHFRGGAAVAGASEQEANISDEDGAQRKYQRPSGNTQVVRRNYRSSVQRSAQAE